GRALPEAVRAPLEAKLGSTFGDVRIHDDVRADRLSRTLAARAFTSGADIFFRAGEYDPHSPAGSRLLAHELVHTVQQARGEVAGESTPAGLRVSPANDAHEIEAERVANAVIR
ncbi:MAG: eCIS core domain-containing protein, partial [Burkholderiales bacterium]